MFKVKGESKKFYKKLLTYSLRNNIWSDNLLSEKSVGFIYSIITLFSRLGII